MSLSRSKLLQSVLIAMLPSMAFAGTASPLGVASEALYTTPSEGPIDTKETQRVRIPITLKTWQTVEALDAKSQATTSRIVSQPVPHVLRARMERANDFYLGDWRVKSVPMRWLRNSQQYQVRLEVYRRLGETGQIEESLGSITLTGRLHKQQDGLYILNGTARRVFRNKSGDPILDFAAGQQPVEKKSTAVSRLSTLEKNH